MDTAKSVKIACTTMAVGVGLVLFAQRVWSRRQKKPSGVWREVGRVTGLNVFPIKSCRGRSVDEARVMSIGLEDVPTDGRMVLGDRRMVIYKETSMEMVSARTYPEMLQITIEAASLTEVKLTYRDQTINVSLTPQIGEAPRKIDLWSEKVTVVDAGDEVAGWLQDVVFEGQPGFRLGFWPDVRVRRDIVHVLRQYGDMYPFMGNEFTGAFSDLSPFLILNDSSVEDVASRVERRHEDENARKSVVAAGNFRGNIVIVGPSPFEEDAWQWIRIGDDVILRNFKPCTRCSLTTVDPATSQRNPKLEPISTLKTYRLLSEGQRKLDPSPAMGIYVGLHSQPGYIIKTGDPVYICD